MIYDMLGDPYERGETSIYYNPWFIEHLPMQYAATAPVGQWLPSFNEFRDLAEARQLQPRRVDAEAGSDGAIAQREWRVGGQLRCEKISAERGEPGNKLDLSEVEKLRFTPFDNAKSRRF